MGQTLCGSGQVQLDDLGGARADEEQLANVGATGQKAFNLAIQFGMGVVQSGQIRFFENRRTESRFCENHHTRRALQQMGAGAGSDDEKEGVLNLAVQPDDSGQTTEYFALAALLENRRAAASKGRRGRKIVHAVCSD